MPTSSTAAVTELEDIEKDVSLHDFSGPHAEKGFDFATYWVIVRVVELEQARQADYALVCEYVQDVAEFDSATQPTRIQLYQLKKKEDGYWTTSQLTGQAGKKKVPKFDKPVAKLLRHVRTFKNTKSSGVFISNAHFEVSLSSGVRSVNDISICLQDWDAAHTDGLKAAIAKLDGVKPEDVDLSPVELRRVALSFDDLRRHTNGIMVEYLNQVAPEHSGQAPALVDAIFAKLKERSRRTDRCKDWDELLTRRGYAKPHFVEAVDSLKSIPDRPRQHQRLLDKLSSDWGSFATTHVEVALARMSRNKVLAGQAVTWKYDEQIVKEVCERAQAEAWTDLQWYELLRSSLETQLTGQAATQFDISALAIYEMTEWTLNQIPV